jgi:hypothetical protein
LLGAFVLAEALMLLVAGLLFTICIGLAGALLSAMGGSVDHMTQALKPAQTVSEVFRPLPLFFSAFEAVMLALWATTLEGVAVSAYHCLVPTDLLGEATPALR